jgi:hypothetical protein
MTRPAFARTFFESLVFLVCQNVSGLLVEPGWAPGLDGYPRTSSLIR